MLVRMIYMELVTELVTIMDTKFHWLDIAY